jgi:hypothetical protein
VEKGRGDGLQAGGGGHRHRGEVDAADDRDVLTNQAQCLARRGEGDRKTAEVIVHEHDVRCLSGDVRRAVERDGDVGISECREVVDPVADEGDPFRPRAGTGSLRPSVRETAHRGRWRRDAQLAPDGPGGLGAVAGEHVNVISSVSRPLDPRALLAAAGFEIEDARRVWLGYPTLCVRARRL